MVTYINDIELDYSTPIPRTREFDITSEPVQSSEVDDVTRHVRSVLPEFTITGAFTSDDREADFQSLLDLADAKETVKVTQYKVYDNMIIKNISETGTYTDTVEFTITFKQVNTVTFETTDVPLKAKKQEVQATSSKGTQKTSTVKMTIPDYPSTI
jgi:hypothetical protein